MLLKLIKLCDHMDDCYHPACVGYKTSKSKTPKHFRATKCCTSGKV